MKNTTEFEGLINKLSESSFNTLIKEYAKEYYETKEVHISNGPYDGGNDLVYSKGEKEIKKNIQITVTKTKIEEKLFEDVAKAKENVSKYAYQSNLDFYISSSISQEKKQKFIRRAEVDYDITLKIVDAKKLAGNMDEYPSIKATLKKVYEIDSKPSLFNITKQEKVVFNIVNSSEDSSKIKKHLIHAYILTNIYETPNSEIESIFNIISKSLTYSFSIKNLTDEINYLKSKGLIEGVDRFSLSQQASSKIEDVIDLNNLQEIELSQALHDLLETKGIKLKSQEIARKLIDLYIQHFQFDVEEFQSSENSFSKSINSIYQELKAILIEANISPSEADSVSTEIIELASTNAFLYKLGASAMYLKLYNSEKIERYFNNNERRVCLDTQILLRLLCSLYNSDVKDNSIKIANRLHHIIKETSNKISAFSTVDYLEEVAAHLQKAIRIAGYIELPIFSKVGKSRNVFYNYYLSLLTEKHISGDLTFLKFIENEIFGTRLKNEFNKDFINDTIRKLRGLFENLNYEIDYVNQYDCFQKVKKEFEVTLTQRRSKTAILHDVRTSLHLSDIENHFDNISENYLEPFMVTWDFQFFTLRNTVKKQFSDFSNWFIYTPQKFIEQISLSKFKINPEAINETILSIVESDFNKSNNKKNFIDAISSIFNKENVNELKVAQKFANLEQEFLTEKEKESNFERSATSESPITIILVILINHFNNPESPNSLTEFKTLCENDEKADQILKIINEAIVDLKQGNLIETDLINQMQHLVNNYA